MIIKFMSMSVPDPFYVLSFIILASAVMVVRINNIFRAGLLLIVTFIGVGGIYLLLQSEFLAFIQVLIYVGAIAVLILFAVMLTYKIMDKDITSFNRQQILSLIAVLVFFGVVILCILNAGWNAIDEKATFDLFDIAKKLMGEFLVPFELISILLLVTLIGAVVLAKKENENDS